jgi:nucleoid DNA-binding protein
MSRNKDLAAALTEKHGLAKTDAEAFVNAMFTLINEALASERAVKVKGLGTFKVISVAARKSVDVNTGAPIVIDGRDKISFTPDSSLRDEVNKPFAQFETVVVNDGVDFSEIDRKFEEEETTKDTGSTEDIPEVTGSTEDTEDTEDIPEVTEDTGSTKDTEDTEDKPEVTEKTGSTEDTEDTEETPEVTEDTEETGSTKDTEDTEDIPEVTEDTEDTEKTGSTKDTEDTEVKPEVTEDTEDTEETKDTKETEETEETDNTDNTMMVEEVEEVKDEMRAVMKSEHRKMRVLMGACAAFVVLCMAGAGYMFTQMQKKDNRISNLEAQVQAFTTLSKQQTAKPQPATPQYDTLQGETVATETTAATATTAPATTSAPATTKPATTTAAATTTTLSAAQAAKTTAQAGKTAQTAKSAGKNAQTAKSATSDAASANYAKDPRIRTGAYNIVGVDRTVTVKAGQTLSSISHFYLGQGMECYVEAVNGGRTEFKAGEKIKIPKLKHKKMR